MDDIDPKMEDWLRKAERVLDRTQATIESTQRRLRSLTRGYEKAIALVAESEKCIKSSRQVLDNLELGCRRWWFSPIDGTAELRMAEEIEKEEIEKNG